MKTKQYILEAYKTQDKETGCLDGRDVTRLAAFLFVEEWPLLGLTVKEGADVSNHVPLEWTRENIIAQLTKDLEFAFSKALDKRGISAGLMYEVILMWMWVLDDELKDFTEYAQYGLPLFKAVAVKYNLPNPIGDDNGDEYKYSSEADYE